jgi:hypothetical protein
VAFELPYDPFVYLKAVNEGIPVVIGAARSAPAERLVRLTGSVFGEDGLVAPSPITDSKKSGEFPAAPDGWRGCDRLRGDALQDDPTVAALGLAGLLGGRLPERALEVLHDRHCGVL